MRDRVAGRSSETDIAGVGRVGAGVGAGSRSGAYAGPGVTLD